METKKIMKTMLFCILMTFTFHSIAQKPSTINFLTKKCSEGITFTLYLNEQLIGSISKDENLEYKIYSEGRISITIIFGSIRVTRSIDVTQGNTYYFVLHPFVDYVIIDEIKGKDLLSKVKNTIKVEEDKKHPIGKLPFEIEEQGPKQGTCFLISKQGYFLTNYHVISGAKNIKIKGIGNDFSTLYGAEVIAFDVDLDLALLKLKNQNIKFDTIPYSLALKTNPQGTKSFALGFPMTTTMGEEIKITEGIINAKSGYKGSISQYQFSAAVQPGNSGSPLFNEYGDIIGVINAKLQGAEGAGYAVKSQYVSAFLNLIENIDIENSKTTISKLSLPEKVTLLKNYIFIVTTE